MNDTLDTSPVDFDAEDAALREHRREANKATRWFILAAGSFGLMFIVLIAAFAFNTMTSKSPVAATPAGATTAPTVNDKDAEITRLRNQILAMQGLVGQGQLGQGQAGQTVTPGGPLYTADPAALAQLAARVDRLEAGQHAMARAAASANAAAALQQAARGDGPFLSQLAVVEASVDDPAAIALLRPYAEKGVPSEVSLAVEFPTVAARANLAAKAAAGNKDVVGKVLRAIGISIRHTDNIDGEGSEAILQRAETRLNVGDLRGAISYLTKLPPAAQTAIKPWMDRAQARLSVDDATQRLTEGALNRLSRSGDLTVQSVTVAPSTGGAL